MPREPTGNALNLACKGPVGAPSCPRYADLPGGRSIRLAWARLGVMPARRARRARQTRERLVPIQRSTAKQVRWPCHNRWRTKLSGTVDLPRNGKASQGTARRFQDGGTLAAVDRQDLAGD